MELRRCAWADTGNHENGVTTYGFGACTQVNGLDFGANYLPGEGFRVKHFGALFEQRSDSLRNKSGLTNGQTEPAIGNVGGVAYDNNLGIVSLQENQSTLTGDVAKYRGLDYPIYGADNGRIISEEGPRFESGDTNLEAVNTDTVTSVFKATGADGYGVVGGIQNLAGVTGPFDGAQAVDDGTNTSTRGTVCIWDDTAGEWVPQDGSARFS
jgi:hypothetical protein